LSRFRVRPLDLPNDYPRLAALLNSIRTEPTTVADLAEGDSKIPPPPAEPGYDDAGRLVSHCRNRFAAVDESGDMVAYADAWRAPWDRPGDMTCSVVVDPACQKQGLGALLADTVERIAREKRAKVLRTWVRDHLPEATAFARRRGFELDRHMFESTLDLATFDEGRFAGVVAAAEAGGIRFFTLADQPTPETEQALYELDMVTSADIPGQEDYVRMAFAEWRKWVLEGTKVRTDCVIIAADGDRVVGFTATHGQDSGAMYTVYTCVDRAYRGRQLALALKLLSVQACRRHGAPYMRTNNDSKNAPMLAVNQKMGYQPAPGFYRMEKTLK
jgi:GNAT superfamily N-acetyltransferase